MAEQSYEYLTVQDRSFLDFESPSAHMHVASVQIYEAAPMQREGGGLDMERLEAFVLSRLHLIPRYLQRLEWTPIRQQPIWVDDAKFNIHYHLRHSRLPKPGDLRQLKRTAARILSQQLDRGKPLWEMWVIEGFEEDRFAVITKVHHCMIDGVAGAELLATLMTPVPLKEIEPPPEWAPRPLPSTTRLAFDEATRAIEAPLRAAEAITNLVMDQDHSRHDLQERWDATSRLLSRGMGGTSDTLLNRPIGPHRRFDWLSMDLGRIREIKTVMGASVNDVVLAIVTGAVRRYLKSLGQTGLDELDFRVLAPVSVRGKDEHGQMGNRVSAWIVDLPIDETDPLERLRKLSAQTKELKRSKQALAAEALTQAVAWTGGLLLALGSQLTTLGQPFNLVVTNVPGPPVPFYLLESRMLEVYPVVPLTGTLASGIALFSYADQLNWGFTGDWDAVPDLHDLVVAVERAYTELYDAAEEVRASGGVMEGESAAMDAAS